MPRFSIHPPEDAIFGDFPEISGIMSAGVIKSRGIVNKEDCPIHLWEHELGSLSSLSIEGSPSDHTFFICSGTVVANGQPIYPQSVVIVEHGAALKMMAPGPAAVVLHWRRSEIGPHRHLKDGGHVHIIGPEGLYEFKADRAVRIWADSDCPTCETWLHCSRPFPPGSAEVPHYHTADEIIYILGGSALIGRQELGPGTAIAIDAHTTYKFQAGAGGLQFLNFAASEPSYVVARRDGTPPTPIKNIDVVKDFIVRKRTA